MDGKIGKQFFTFMFACEIFIISVVYGDGRCSAYCDKDGYPHRAFNCNSPGEEFCCGTQTNRYCCGNATMDITGKYDDRYVCERTSWWLYHWQIIIGLLGTIIVLLLVAACCCQCCGICKRNRTSSSGQGSDPEVNTAGNGDDTDTQRIQAFDPQHPFAFNPPSYDSLPKEPPKYDEIYEEGSNGVVNQAFSMGPMSTLTSDNSADSSIVGVHTVSRNATDGQVSPRSPSTIQFTTHGSNPLEELPPYEVAILEPSTSMTVNYIAPPLAEPLPGVETPRPEQTSGPDTQTRR